MLPHVPIKDERGQNNVFPNYTTFDVLLWFYELTILKFENQVFKRCHCIAHLSSNELEFSCSNDTLD